MSTTGMSLSDKEQNRQVKMKARPFYFDLTSDFISYSFICFLFIYLLFIHSFIYLSIYSF
jgi:hypothetical protein